MLDRQAWTQLNLRLDELLFSVIPDLEDEAAQRMAVSGEEPIPTTYGLTAFRSPKQSEIYESLNRSQELEDGETTDDRVKGKPSNGSPS